MEKLLKRDNYYYGIKLSELSLQNAAKWRKQELLNLTKLSMIQIDNFSMYDPNSDLIKIRLFSLKKILENDIDSLERTIETYGNNPIERFAQLRKMVDERLGHVQNNNNVEVKVEQATPQLSPELLSLIQQQIGQQKAAVGDVNNFNNAQQNVMNQTNNNGMSFPWS